jgi:hypothetical protein
MQYVVFYVLLIICLFIIIINYNFKVSEMNEHFADTPPIRSDSGQAPKIQPKVTESTPPVSDQPKATAVVSESGMVSSVQVSNAGSDLDDLHPPEIQFITPSGASGTGAKAQVLVKSGKISAIIMTNGGQKYKSSQPPEIKFTENNIKSLASNSIDSKLQQIIDKLSNLSGSQTTQPNVVPDDNLLKAYALSKSGAFSDVKSSQKKILSTPTMPDTTMPMLAVYRDWASLSKITQKGKITVVQLPQSIALRQLKWQGPSQVILKNIQGAELIQKSFPVNPSYHQWDLIFQLTSSLEFIQVSATDASNVSRLEIWGETGQSCDFYRQKMQRMNPTQLQQPKYQLRKQRLQQLSASCQKLNAQDAAQRQQHLAESVILYDRMIADKTKALQKDQTKAKLELATINADLKAEKDAQRLAKQFKIPPPPSKYTPKEIENVKKRAGQFKTKGLSDQQKGACWALFQQYQTLKAKADDSIRLSEVNPSMAGLAQTQSLEAEQLLKQYNQACD